MTVEFVALIITILSSSVAVAAWITSRLAKIEIEVKHAFLRIVALEAKTSEAPATPAARARSRKR